MNLLAAQLYAESGFNPFATSGAGAQGIAQFMPGTAHSYGLRDPFDPDAAIDAQAHLMSDLLKDFGGKPALALAAYKPAPGRCSATAGYRRSRRRARTWPGSWASSAAPGRSTWRTCSK